ASKRTTSSQPFGGINMLLISPRERTHDYFGRFPISESNGSNARALHTRNFSRHTAHETKCTRKSLGNCAPPKSAAQKSSLGTRKSGWREILLISSSDLNSVKPFSTPAVFVRLSQ